MKKLFIFAIATLGMLACSPKNDPSNPTVEIKDGALPGKFSVSAHDMVQFSQGNLQYKPSTKTWRFAEHQYDTISPYDTHIPDTYDDWIAHFNWYSGEYPTGNPYGSSSYTFFEWGIHAISNGGNNPNQWRTLTAEEWVYLFRGRTNAGSLFALGTVNGTHGAIVLPDNWITPSGLSFGVSTTKGLKWNTNIFAGTPIAGWEIEAYMDTTRNHYTDNIYTSSEWSKMEAAGAVFLPAEGSCYLDNVHRDEGVYWSSSHHAQAGDRAYYLRFMSGYLIPQIDGIIYENNSVRLVQDCQ